MLAEFKSRSRQHRQCVLVEESICVSERQRVSSARGKIMTGENGWLVTRWRGKCHIFWASGWADVKKLLLFSLLPPDCLLHSSSHHPSLRRCSNKGHRRPKWFSFSDPIRVCWRFRSSVSRARSENSDRMSHGGFFNKPIFWLILMALANKIFFHWERTFLLSHVKLCFCMRWNYLWQREILRFQMCILHLLLCESCLLGSGT